MIQDPTTGADLNILRSPLRIECHLSLEKKRPDVPWDLVTEDLFHAEFPFCRERGYEPKLVPGAEEGDSPMLYLRRPMDSIEAAIEEVGWLFGERLPVGR